MNVDDVIKRVADYNPRDAERGIRRGYQILDV